MPITSKEAFLSKQRMEDKGHDLFQKQWKRGSSARTKRRATAKLTRQKESLAEALEIVQDDKRHEELMKRMEFINKELERNECD